MSIRRDRSEKLWQLTPYIPLDGRASISFPALLALFRSDDCDWKTRIAIRTRLVAQLGDASRLRGISQEPFRSGGPGLCSQLAVKTLVPQLPYSVNEVASLVQIDPSGIHKALADKKWIQPVHWNVVLAIQHHMGLPWRDLPTDLTNRQWVVAGLCRATPRLHQVIGGGRS